MFIDNESLGIDAAAGSRTDIRFVKLFAQYGLIVIFGHNPQAELRSVLDAILVGV